MATYQKFNQTVLKLGSAKFDFTADTLKIALSNSAPIATNAVLADITQISAANGYSSGGTAVPSSAYSQTSGTATLSGNAVTFTASGGSMGTFQYVVLYDSTSASGPLIGWWDYGAAVTLTVGNTFTVNFNGSATGGTIFTLT